MPARFGGGMLCRSHDKHWAPLWVKLDLGVVVETGVRVRRTKAIAMNVSTAMSEESRSATTSGCQDSVDWPEPWVASPIATSPFAP
jgi:hypothetical protein